MRYIDLMTEASKSQTVWHGTFAQITQMKPLFHCGTWKAAVMRVVQKAKDQGSDFWSTDPTANFYPFVIKSTAKFLTSQDYGEDFNILELTAALSNNPKYEEKFADYVTIHKAFNNKQMINNVINFCLQEKIDGFKYANHLEDSGSLSYIIVNVNAVAIKQLKKLPLSTFVDITSKNNLKIRSLGI